MADDEDDLKSIRAKSKKKDRVDLDTGLPGIPAPFAESLGTSTLKPSDYFGKRAGGRIKARGVGAAKRGYGKGPYSDKLI